MRLALLALLASAVPGAKEPAVVILCAGGTVYPKSGSVATGRDCVARDRDGHTASVQHLSAYDDGDATP